MKTLLSIWEDSPGVLSSKRVIGTIIIIASIVYAFLGLFNKSVIFNIAVFSGLIGAGSGLIGLGVIDNATQPPAGSGDAK